MQSEDRSVTEIATVETQQPNGQDASSSALASAELYRHVSMVVREVENRYREGILAYIDVLAQYEEEIGGLQQKLSEAKAAAAPEEAKLSILAGEIRVEERMLERLNSEFLQKLTDYEAFEHEYSPLMEEGNAVVLKRSKRGEIERLQDEIEEGESKLLSLELERLNQIEKLEPIRSEIGNIEHTLSELERKKRYFETTHLQQMHMRPDTLLAASSESAAQQDTEA